MKNARWFLMIFTVVLVSTCSGSAPHPGLPAPGQHMVGVAPLWSASAEEEGYGLYSYVLFTKAPQPGGRDLAVFEELAKMPTAEGLKGAGLSKDRVNLTLVPEKDQSTYSPRSAEWWIAHYDLERSVQMLFVQQISGNGPFIVTSKYGLTYATTKRQVSIIDLSGSTPESARAWLQHFRNVSERPEDWIHNGAGWLMLKLDKAATAVSLPVQLVVEALPEGEKLLKIFGPS